MIWSKTVLVWSRLEIFVDSGQNQRLQYFRGWSEKRDEQDGDVFDGSRSEILLVEDAEFVLAKGLTIPTALDGSIH